MAFPPEPDGKRCLSLGGGSFWEWPTYVQPQTWWGCAGVRKERGIFGVAGNAGSVVMGSQQRWIDFGNAQPGCREFGLMVGALAVAVMKCTVAPGDSPYPQIPG
eukprot:GGOE01003849.1.p3 GENE.GGOE01003849.1~~GGOE01003849.1.p3  ORF type:complete len:104 (+),score=0.30 GGOE01003849.1:357-668(+)